MDKAEIRKKLEDLSDRISPNGISEDEKTAILSELNDLLGLAPDDTDILFWKAMVYEVSNDYLNAINIYTRILELEPENKDVINSIENCKELMHLNSIKAEQTTESQPPRPSIMEKVSVWYILLGKIIILASIIYFCFMQ